MFQKYIVSLGMKQLIFSSNRKTRCLGFRVSYYFLLLVFLICSLSIYVFLIEVSESRKISSVKVVTQSVNLFANKRSTKQRKKHRSDDFDNILHSKFVRQNQEWRIWGENDKCKQLKAGNTSMLCGLGCDDLKKMTDITYLAYGWTKAVYSAKLYGKTVAVKVVNTQGQDIKKCLRKVADMEFCYRKASAKILNEIFYLRVLEHTNIVKMLGYCVPYEDPAKELSSVVIIATELGEPLDLIKLLQMSWDDRLRVARDITELLYHLSNSPLGPAAIRDFRRQQFVLIKGVLKLSDVDDLSFGNPSCRSTMDCVLITANVTAVKYITCEDQYCYDYNDRSNIVSAAKQMVGFSLINGTPAGLLERVKKFVEAYRYAQLSSLTLQIVIERITRAYSSGSYRAETTNYLKEYIVQVDCDLPGQFDYHCQSSASLTSCVISVIDAEEAADFCTHSSECKAFVLSSDVTWTGRKIAYFKKAVGPATNDARTMLYIKKEKSSVDKTF